jgi:hypothetical protein
LYFIKGEERGIRRNRERKTAFLPCLQGDEESGFSERRELGERSRFFYYQGLVP